MNGLIKMIKRTLCFASPGSLRLHLRQMVWKGEDGRDATIPIEDIGILILESPLITLSTALLQELSAAGVAVVVCDSSHLPSASLLPHAGHTLSNRILHQQITLTDARANMIWQQIVSSKITNQASAIQTWSSETGAHLLALAMRVKRGDPDNLEAQAAHAYFSSFPTQEPTPFHRSRAGEMPNAALNYGYAILRAAVARALVGSGLNPAFGLHHRNQYNSFCLADDIMEPYRPFVDLVVLENLPLYQELNSHLTPEGKRTLLPFLTMDVLIKETTRPLFNAIQLTTASLARIVCGEQKHLELPAFPQP